MNINKILEEIGNELPIYLRQGKIKIDALARVLDPNLDINNLTGLLRIHFVLKRETIEFIRKLEGRVRNIKTTVRSEEYLTKRQIRGRIKWKKTYRERCKINLSSKTLFVCSLMEREFSIIENVVLKTLLSIIKNIIEIDLKFAFENKYLWINEWYKDDDKLRKLLIDTYLKNIYLRKIESKKANISQRKIQSVLNSRKPLYSEAAKLLLCYNSLMSFEIDEDEAKELLRNTLILPNREDILFELYWIIKIVKSFSDAKFNLIYDNNQSIISDWKKDDYHYTLYHNSTGSFRFKEKFKEIKMEMLNIYSKDNYILRQLDVLEKLEEMGINKKDCLYGGRPDILLEKRKGNKIVSLFIGEVKNTKKKEYAIQGLKQLLEYMVLIKKGDRYYNSDKNNFFNNKIIKGGLFIDNISDLALINSGNLNVDIYKFGKWENFDF